MEILGYLIFFAVLGYFSWFGILVLLGTLFANGDVAKEKKIATLSAWIATAICGMLFLDRTGFLSIP
jgi:hypothetical protein